MPPTGLRTLTVPAKLHRELKTAAAHDGRTLGDVVAEALAQWLEERRKDVNWQHAPACPACGTPAEADRHDPSCPMFDTPAPPKPGRDTEPDQRAEDEAAYQRIVAESISRYER